MGNRCTSGGAALTVNTVINVAGEEKKKLKENEAAAVTNVVRRRAGLNSSPKLGRVSVPFRRRSLQLGDSGTKGSMRAMGIAGIKPE
jgi:hypothetical protein